MFGQGTGDFSIGASAFSNTLTNTYGNDPSSNSSAFDLSDFPSLGGGGSSNSSGGGSSGQQQAMLRQQMAAQQQQQKSSELYRLTATNNSANNGGGINDGGWPALGGGGGSSGTSGASSNGGNNVGGFGSPSILRRAESNPEKGPTGSVPRTNSNNSAPSGFYTGGIGGSNSNTTSTTQQGSVGGGSGGDIGGASIGSSSGGSTGGVVNHVDGVLGGLGGLSSLQQQSTQQRTSSQQQPGASQPSSTGGGSTAGGSSSSTGGGSGGPGSAMRGDYGLLGLLQLIRMPDCDRKALALGSELSLFASFTENAKSKEPHYQLPMCYYMQPPALKTGHLSKFQLETLFYIFYSLPKDVLQAYSAQELYTREWRYHGELQLWFKEVGPADGNIAGANAANAPTNGQPQYMYFDINSWERRLCNNANMANKNITSGFLSEDDVRVKFSGSS